jgi:hypothetical protein
MVTGWEYIESIEWQCNQEVFPINLPSSYPAVKLDFSNLNCIGKIEINNSGAESLELNFGNKEIKIFDEIKVVSGGELKLIIHDVKNIYLKNLTLGGVNLEIKASNSIYVNELKQNDGSKKSSLNGISKDVFLSGIINIKGDVDFDLIDRTGKIETSKLKKLSCNQLKLNEGLGSDLHGEIVGDRLKITASDGIFNQYGNIEFKEVHATFKDMYIRGQLSVVYGWLRSFSGDIKVLSGGKINILEAEGGEGLKILSNKFELEKGGEIRGKRLDLAAYSYELDGMVSLKQLHITGAGESLSISGEIILGGGALLANKENGVLKLKEGSRLSHMDELVLSGNNVELNGANLEGGFKSKRLKVEAKLFKSIDSTIIEQGLHIEGTDSDKSDSILFESSNVDVVGDTYLQSKTVTWNRGYHSHVIAKLGEKFSGQYDCRHDPPCVWASVEGSHDWYNLIKQPTIFKSKNLIINSDDAYIVASVVQVYQNTQVDGSKIKLTIHHRVAKETYKAISKAKYYLTDEMDYRFYKAASEFGCSRDNIKITSTDYWRHCDSGCSLHYTKTYVAECLIPKQIYLATFTTGTTSGVIDKVIIGLGSIHDTQKQIGGGAQELNKLLSGSVSSNALVLGQGYLVEQRSSSEINEWSNKVLSNWVSREIPIEKWEQKANIMEMFDASDVKNGGYIVNAGNLLPGSDVENKEYDVLVREKYKSLYECKEGTITLLQELGIAAKDAGKIFATPSLEAVLVERIGANRLGNIDMDYRPIGNIPRLEASTGNKEEQNDENNELPRCKNLGKLINNAKLAKEELGLEIGKALSESAYGSIKKAFAWPVYKSMIDVDGRNHHILALDVYLPTETIEDSALHKGGTKVNLGHVEAEIGGILNVGELKTQGGNLKVDTIIQLGELKNEGSEEINVQFNRALISSVVHYLKTSDQIDSQVLTKATIEGLEKASTIKLITKGNVAAYATRFNNVAFEVGGDVVIMPIPLIKAYKGYITKERYQERIDISNLAYELNGDIQIISQGDVKLIGADSSKVKVLKINGRKGVTVEPAYEIEYRHSVETDEDVFSYEEITTKELNIRPVLHAIGREDSDALNVEIKSEEGEVRVIGTRIYSKELELRAGSIDHPRKVNLLPSLRERIYEQSIETSSFGIGFNGGMLTFGEDSSEQKKESRQELEPTILRIEDRAYIYSEGQYLQLASSINSKGVLHISSPTGYKISALESKRVSYYSFNREMVGVGFVATSDELSLKAGVIISQEEYGLGELTPIYSSIKANKLLIDGKGVLETKGVVMSWNEGYFDIAKHIDRSAMKELVESQELTEVELMFKIGFRNNLGNLVKAAENLEDQGLDSTEGVINTGFAAFAAYTAWLKAVAAPIEGGAWIEGTYKDSRIDIKKVTPILTHIDGHNTRYENLEKIDYEGTQVSGSNWYISAKEVILGASFSSYEQKSRSFEGGITIPVAGNAIGVSVGMGTSHMQSEGKVYTSIDIKGELVMEIEGKLTLNGAEIFADSLRIDAGKLLIKSLENVSTSKERGFNLSLDLKAKAMKKLSGIGFRIGDGDRKWIDDISKIIGRDNLEIVIAESLEIIGSTIANAEVGEDGKLKKDKGNLHIKAAEIYARDLYGYDDGHLFGASVKLAYDDSSGVGNEYRANFGYKNLEQLVRATIGIGKLEIGNKDKGVCKIRNEFIKEEEFCYPDDYKGNINRDINNIQEEGGVEVKEIKAYWAELKGESKSLKEGVKDIVTKSAWTIVDSYNKVTDYLGDLFGDKKDTLSNGENSHTNKLEVNKDAAKKDSNQDTFKSSSIIYDIDAELIDKYPELKEDEYKRLSIVALANYLEQNEKVLDRAGAIETARAAVNKYVEDNPIIRPAALPLAVAAGLGLAQTFKMCMAKPACAEAIMGISIGAAAWLGFKVTADKLKDESYESIKSDDSNDQNKKNIKQQPGSSAAAGAPDPDDDFDPDDWEKNKEERFHHPEAKDIKGIHNKPNAHNPQLRKALDELYKPTDKYPGGTAGILRKETELGWPKEHLIKAGQSIARLKEIINNEPLSRTDRKIAERLIHDLRSAIKQAGGL